jgi:hypothetical protein
VDKPVVSVGVVGVQCDIGDDTDFRTGCLDGADHSRDQARVVKTRGCIAGFHAFGNFGKQHDSRDAACMNGQDFGDEIFFAPSDDARHGDDGIILIAFLNEQGLNKIGWSEHCLANQGTNGRAFAIAAGADGKIHGFCGVIWD